MSALARWCFRHRLLVVGIWAAVLVALAVPYATLGARYSDAFSLPGTESSKAQARLQASEPRQAGDSDQIWCTCAATGRSGTPPSDRR